MKNKKENVMSIILGLYLAFVTAPVDWTWYSSILFIIKLAIFPIIINKVIKVVSKINYQKTNETLKWKDYLFWFIYSFVIMLIAILIYYPNNFTYDTNIQYKQAITGLYSDWHPIIHTVFFYRLPTLLIKSKMMCCLFHMTFISIILLYFCYVLHKYGFNKKIITIILSIFILNPSFDFMSISILKDVAFSYCLFLMTLFLINIYLSDGTWLNQKKNYIMFLLTCFGMTFFRHNGIFNFVVIMLLLIIIYKDIRKKSCYIFVIILSLRFIFIPYIYKINGIKKTNATFSEMVCVLLDQVAYIYNDNGKITDNQLKKLNKMQDLSLISKYYNPYDYNSVKYKMDFYSTYSPYLNSHKLEFLKLWKDIVLANPIKALKSYLYASYFSLHIDVDSAYSNTDLLPVVYSQNPKITDAGLEELQKNHHKIKSSLSQFPLNFILLNISTALFFILFSLCYCLIKGKEKFKNKFKLILPYIPVLSNFCLLMIMFPGREARFFYANILCVYPLIIFMLLINKKEKVINN